MKRPCLVLGFFLATFFNFPITLLVASKKSFNLQGC